MIDDKKKPQSFWTTLPGLLTGCATLVTAIGGCIGIILAAPLVKDFFLELVQTPTIEPTIVQVPSVTPKPSAPEASTSFPPAQEDVLIPTITPTPSPTPTPSFTPNPELTITILDVSTEKTYFVGNLYNGAPVYADRNYLFTEIPSFLMDENYIITANGDKFGGRDFAYTLRFYVNQEVIVYVAHDDDYPNKPDWLKSFSDTNSDLIYYVGNDRVVLSLYEKSFPSGTISLGGNVSSIETENHTMYSVVIAKK